MGPLKERILRLVADSPGLTDREITDRLLGPRAPQQSVNQAARQLCISNGLMRQVRDDGLLGNYLRGTPVRDATRVAAAVSRLTSSVVPSSAVWPAEDAVKLVIQRWLHSTGWSTVVRWAREHGADIVATRGEEEWLIEVKGGGSLSAMRVNYFLMSLGELCQRMKSESALHSIALPDLQQYRRLWERLPSLAKSRLKVSAIFVSEVGEVNHVG